MNEELRVVEYETDAEGYKKYLKQFWLFGSKLTWILAGIFVALMLAACIVYGVGKDTLWAAIAIGAAIIVVSVVAVRFFELPTYLRNGEKEFVASNEGGKVKCKVEFDGKKYILSQSGSEAPSEYRIEEIVSAFEYRDIFLVRFTLRQYLIFPNTEEIRQIFSAVNKTEEAENE